MKPKHFFLQLVLSSAGVSPVFAAWEYERNGVEDEGGGTYNFRIENQYFTYRGESYDASHLDWFRTNNKFDVAKDQFYFEFEMRVCCDMIIDNDHIMDMLTGDSELENTLLEGEVYVVTSDDVSHLIGTWRKKKTNWKSISYESLDEGYSALRVHDLNNFNGHVKVNMLLGEKAFSEGVKRVVFRNRLVYRDSRQWGWFLYEKDIDLSSLNESQPMPRLSAEWNEEGGVTYTASDLRKVLDDSLFLSRDYHVERYYYHDGLRRAAHSRATSTTCVFGAVLFRQRRSTATSTVSSAARRRTLCSTGRSTKASTFAIMPLTSPNAMQSIWRIIPRSVRMQCPRLSCQNI